jgi:hypothetical protein
MQRPRGTIYQHRSHHLGASSIPGKRMNMMFRFEHLWHRCNGCSSMFRCWRTSRLAVEASKHQGNQTTARQVGNNDNPGEWVSLRVCKETEPA